jgi:hypothetical protein
MYQVTAIYGDSEIGFGEGEGLLYAIDDCAASIPSIFEHEKVVLSVLKNGVLNRQVKGRIYIDVNGIASICDRVEI